MSALQPIYRAPIAYKQGGVISVTSNTTLSITSLLQRSIANDFDINIGDYFGANSATVLNAAVVGLNGIDTGALAASTVYAVWAIADAAGYNPSGFILSLNSTTGPQMPYTVYRSGYNTFVRVGWAVTDSSAHFLTLRVSGQGSVVRYTYEIPPFVLNGGVATSQTAVSLSSSVPAVNLIPVQFAAQLVAGAASQSGQVCVSGLAGGVIANSKNLVIGQVATVANRGTFEVPAAVTSGVPAVDYTVSNAASNLSLWVLSFDDYLL